MKNCKRLWLALAAGCTIFLSLVAPAQETDKPRFAAPVRLKAGDAFLGARRIYASPVFIDVNGDGKLDIVVGDLPGRVTVALREAGGEGIRFTAEKPLTQQDGKPLKFHNW